MFGKDRKIVEDTSDQVSDRTSRILARVSTRHTEPKPKPNLKPAPAEGASAKRDCPLPLKQSLVPYIDEKVSSRPIRKEVLDAKLTLQSDLMSEIDISVIRELA